MRELGVGIIGCGVISTTYMQNMSMFASIRLRACADRNPDKARAQAAKFGGDALTPDEVLRRDDVDIVVNLTGPMSHFEVSHAALTAGKHVFTEKPLTVAVIDGRRLVAEAESRGLLLGSAPDTFLGAGGRLARRILDEGQIGRVVAGSIFLGAHGHEHWHPNPEFFYKPGGGPILDIGPYYLSALVNLLGPIAEVQALGSIGSAERVVTAKGPREGDRIAVKVDTTVMALLRFASGAQVALTMSWDVWKHGHPPIELYGTEGSLRVPDPNFFGGTVGVTRRDDEWRDMDSAGLPLGLPNYRSMSSPPTRPLQANYRCVGVAELASAILGNTPHRASGRLALHVLEVMTAILDAAAGRGSVQLASGAERPAALSDEAARALARQGAAI
jgi:predicted dehydrogenase